MVSGACLSGVSQLSSEKSIGRKTKWMGAFESPAAEGCSFGTRKTAATHNKTGISALVPHIRPGNCLLDARRNPVVELRNFMILSNCLFCSFLVPGLWFRRCEGVYLTTWC